MATSTEYTRAEPDRLMRSPMARHLGSVSPRVTLPTPASTPVGMSMAASPSYGGVSIQVPSADRDEVENGTLRPGAFYPPFQPPMTTTSGWNYTGTLPAWSAAPATPTPANCGNRGERYQTSMGLPHGPETNQFNSQEGWYGTQATGGYSRQNVPIIRIPTELRNAVKDIVPFYSDTATSEVATAFWRSFEKCTYGMDGQMRLTAFEQCLKGKTPAQLWNRLKADKRNRGESAEEWGDRIATMCEALNYYDPRRRYEFFLDGLRNKQTRAVLNASMVTSIPEVCALLLYKNLHLPVEEEDEFAGNGTLPSSTSSSTSTQSQMLQQLQRMNQMMLKQQHGSGTHRGFVNVVAPTAPQASGVPTSDGNANANLEPLNIRLGPDTRTTEGEIVCGRSGEQRNALKPKDECKEGVEAEVPSTSSTQYKNALESSTEDASSVRAGRFSVVIGMVGASKVETETLEVENDEESTKGTASTSCYDRLFTDVELDMLERGGDQVVKDRPEEYEKELEERLFPLDDKERCWNARLEHLERRSTG
ncbi:hypothetical protein PC114_g26486 [Phytophthora cactorum]|nr:hypothetical protein PC114_g26486 [Phytophthora cactorum]